MNKLVHFATKFRLLHILFWLWTFYDLVHLRVQFHGGSTSAQVPPALIIKGFQIICVYTILDWLIPKFMDRNRYTIFLSLSLGVIALTSALSVFGESFYTYLVKGEFFTDVAITIISRFTDTFVITGIFVAIVTLSSRYINDQRAKKIEKERLETELNFLKAQINPHFLFNALNSIYVLIDEDKRTARETLLKFSGLLRYQLYECGDNAVDIEKELRSLNDYIGLEALRNGEHLNVLYKHPPNIPHFRIAPFLLIPFVENAFKHVSHHTDKENFVRIETEISEYAFNFLVSNTFEEVTSNHGTRNGGIGLQNVLRRLELLYPSSHELVIRKAEGVHTINLKLYADKTEMHHS
jgi:sensor histidine kinase YesM